MHSRLVSYSSGPRTFWAVGPLPTLSHPRRLAALTGPRHFMDAALRGPTSGYLQAGDTQRSAHTPAGAGRGHAASGASPVREPEERSGAGRGSSGTEAAPEPDPKQREAPPRAAAAPPSPPPGPREQRAAPANRRHGPPYLTEAAADPPPPPPAVAAQAKDVGTALPSGSRGVPGAARHAGTRSPPRGPQARLGGTASRCLSPPLRVSRFQIPESPGEAVGVAWQRPPLSPPPPWRSGEAKGRPEGLRPGPSGAALLPAGGRRVEGGRGRGTSRGPLPLPLPLLRRPGVPGRAVCEFSRV
ncbi:atherin-like [Cygnus olor]|uniref:atherin-like n=1 Tax=Cygnus olor TaxID=8869 RepID=UPI001ADDFBAE|nr:atherin-like [Cygnus olor]